MRSTEIMFIRVWRVGEPKVHNLWFEEFSVYDEGSLLLIFLFDLDVVIASLYVKFSKDMSFF